MKMRAPKLVLVAVLASSVSACGGSLLTTDLPPAEIYVIAPAPAASAAREVLPVDVSVARPDVNPGLDTNRVAVLKGRRLDYYRAARWGGTLTEVVQALLVDSLEDQQLFRSVTTEQARVAGDYVLDVELRDFQAEYATEGATPTARVKMIGRLIRITDRELVATVAADAQQAAAENRMHAVAAALEAAAHQVVIELGQRSYAAIAADRERVSAAPEASR